MNFITTENGVMVKIVDAWQNREASNSEYYILLNTIIGFNKYTYKDHTFSSVREVEEYHIIVNFPQGRGINGINNYISVTKECYDTIVKILRRD